MTAVRLALVALLCVTASVEAAPAPMPKSRRDPDRTVPPDYLSQEFRNESIRLKKVEWLGRDAWVVTFYDFRGVFCGNTTLNERLRHRRFTAASASAALLAFLCEVQRENERELSRLRARGLIP